MNVIGYARWSSLEQSRGSTLARQLQEIERCCRANSWRLIEQVTDEGTSAYTGANIQTGNLAHLIKRIEQGEVSRDVVIAVEQLDRLSRLPPSQVVAWIQRVTALGVTIATANDGMLINSQMIDANPMHFMSIVFNAFRAFQESKHKSERLAASWRIKRQRLESGDHRPITSVCPAWLQIGENADGYVEIPERGDLIREIFERTAAGDGKRAIANDFNLRGIDTWGRGASKANGWHTSYIHKILSNAAVVGEFRPHTKARGSSRRQPVGDPIQGYFPAVVSEQLWARVRSLKPLSKGNDGQRGNVNNLLSGLGRCGNCGSKMTFQLKTPEGLRLRNGQEVRQRRASYLSCDNRQRKLGCINGRYFRYEPLEEGILNALIETSLKDSFFVDSGHVSALAEAEYGELRELDAQKARAGRLLDLFTETGDLEVKERWISAKAALATSAAKAATVQNQLRRARGGVSPDEHVTRVAALRMAVRGPQSAESNAARTRVARALRELIDHIEFDGAGYILMVIRDQNMVIHFDAEGGIIGDVSVAGRVEAATQEALKELLRSG